MVWLSEEAEDILQHGKILIYRKPMRTDFNRRYSGWRYVPQKSLTYDGTTDEGSAGGMNPGFIGHHAVLDYIGEFYYLKYMSKHVKPFPLPYEGETRDLKIFITEEDQIYTERKEKKMITYGWLKEIVREKGYGFNRPDIKRK